jgi:hypothetical protein
MPGVPVRLFLITLIALPVLAGSVFASEPLTFKGHPCTNDCSGHKAGYAWAEKNGISSEEGCTGRSNSFREGCYSWVQEQTAPETEEPQEDDSSEESTYSEDQ